MHPGTTYIQWIRRFILFHASNHPRLLREGRASGWTGQARDHRHARGVPVTFGTLLPRLSAALGHGKLRWFVASGMPSDSRIQLSATDRF